MTRKQIASKSALKKVRQAYYEAFTAIAKLNNTIEDCGNMITESEDIEAAKVYIELAEEIKASKFYARVFGEINAAMGN